MLVGFCIGLNVGWNLRPPTHTPTIDIRPTAYWPFPLRSRAGRSTAARSLPSTLQIIEVGYTEHSDTNQCLQIIGLFAVLRLYKGETPRIICYRLASSSVLFTNSLILVFFTENKTFGSSQFQARWSQLRTIYPLQNYFDLFPRGHDS